MRRISKKIAHKLIILIIVIVFLISTLLFFSPKILTWSIQQKSSTINASLSSQTFQDFPVTVDPKNKTITENDQVNAFLADKHSLLGAAVADAGNYLWNLFEGVAISIANAPWYENTASVSNKFVTIEPGMRKEQVADAFGNALKWNSAQRKEFISPINSFDLSSTSQSTSLSEGVFTPGIYEISLGMTPKNIRAIVNNHFINDVLSHYSTSTQSIVPLNEALTIASLIQRETLSTDGMRLLSGIIWNRLFAGMDLQIDSTLQYAKANKLTVTTWWPKVTPNDKYIKSPFNTYLHNGLPPTPIANPGVEAILAALNPIKTSCLFYFNDQTGAFHCSDTYAEHVSLIKKYYGN